MVRVGVCGVRLCVLDCVLWCLVVGVGSVCVVCVG